MRISDSDGSKERTRRQSRAVAKQISSGKWRRGEGEGEGEGERRTRRQSRAAAKQIS
jgi:hypothetical protein